MKNSNDGIGLLEQQMANDEEVCCSYGNITAFPEAFFDNFRVADIGLIRFQNVYQVRVVKV